MMESLDILNIAISPLYECVRVSCPTIQSWTPLSRTLEQIVFSFVISATNIDWTIRTLNYVKPDLLQAKGLCVIVGLLFC